MNITLTPSKTRYIEQVAEGLTDLSEEDRDEVIQDLEAHLAELDDDEVTVALGRPDEFVREFRTSAGLIQSAPGSRPGRLSVFRDRLDAWSRRLADVTNWATVRPLWIWARGWLLIASLAVLSQSTPFRHFPIPSIEGSMIGLLLVVLATWLSILVDQRQTGLGEFLSAAASALTGLVLLIGLVAGISLSKAGHGEVIIAEDPGQPDQLIGAGGEQITNIFAYDQEGKPVDVLLFDQDGRPLLSLPTWVYEEAERNPGFEEPFEYGPYAVRFSRDEFGRPITNLYPLTMLEFGPDGWSPVPPPPLGFPRVDKTQIGTDMPVTTTMPAFGG